DYYTSVKNREQYTFITQDIQLRYLEYRAGILSDSQQIAMGSLGSDARYDVASARDVYRRMMAKKAFLDHLPLIIQSKIRTMEVLENRHNAVIRLQNTILEELNSK
ncbi:MAG TPA: hypothetical protein VLL47_12685, partial [Robiginitalea sp.]|nr:hypothetical protein [Robiginitalea sp.]